MAGAQQPIGVLVALGEEMRAIEPVLRGRNVVLARTGIGKKNAREKTAAFLESAKPGLVIATGFAGGLRPGLAAGDVIVASRVVELGREGASWTAPEPLLAACRGLRIAGHEVRSATLLTVAKVLGSAQAKRTAAEETGADAVDMESSGVLEAADALRVPVLCVRAILDESGFELPFDFGKILTPDGKPRLGESLRAIAANPAGLAKLLPLRARAQEASRSLAEIIPKIVEALS
jgi:adenosylhomocysteine nucleosidase